MQNNNSQFAAPEYLEGEYPSLKVKIEAVIPRYTPDKFSKTFMKEPHFQCVFKVLDGEQKDKVVLDRFPTGADRLAWKRTNLARACKQTTQNEQGHHQLATDFDPILLEGEVIYLSTKLNQGRYTNVHQYRNLPLDKQEPKPETIDI